MSPTIRLTVALTLICSSAVLAGAEDLSHSAVATFLLLALATGLLPLSSGHRT
jgi:hypothetical protein